VSERPTVGSETDGRQTAALGGGVAVLVTIHLLALVAFPDGLAAPSRALVALLSGAVAAGALAVGGEAAPWAVGGGVAVSLAAAGVWLLGRLTGELWQATALVIAVAALASYGVHRYALLEVGLLEEST